MPHNTEVLEWTHIDKSKWERGPWDSEPDKMQWVDEATGLDCLIHRGPGGALCGYVGVAEGHPYFEVDYSGCTRTPKCEESYCDHSPDVSVHGGLTYAAFCQERNMEREPLAEGEHPEARGICHLPFPGRPHRVWWLGFDCGHSGDKSDMSYRARNPDHEPFGREWFDVYRDRSYVEQQVRSLASQLAAVAAPSVAEAPADAR